MFVNYALHLEVDLQTSGVTAKLFLEPKDGLGLVSLASTEFGPFDTSQDVCHWLCKELDGQQVFRLR